MYNVTFGALKQLSANTGNEDTLNKQNSVSATPILWNCDCTKSKFCLKLAKINILMVRIRSKELLLFWNNLPLIPSIEATEINKTQQGPHPPSETVFFQSQILVQN